MNILVCYDVATQTPAGARRLRQVAKACEGYGQRVQDSVFECSLSPTELELLRGKLLKIIDIAEDSLRIYRMAARREEVVEAYGRDLYRDLKGPLIV